MHHAPIPTDAAGRALRHDGWTPDRQRAFLEAIAAGETVERACRLVQMSVASAYALKQRAAGQSFALGWRAANLLSREAIADRMLTRAIDGQVETVTRPDGTTYSRHKYDNRTAMNLLTRLDRMAEQAPADADAAAHAQAARFVAQDWEAYLALLDADRGPAAAGLFLARRLPDAAARPGMEPVLALARADAFVRTGAGLAEEVATADLDPAQRATWTGEQWARAEAAGLIRLAPEPDTAPAPQHVQLVDEEEDEEPPVWWDEDLREWRTRFAPPPGALLERAFGKPGEEEYERELTEDELAIAERNHALGATDRTAEAEAERQAFFAQLEAEIAAAQEAAVCPEPVEMPSNLRHAGPVPASTGRLDQSDEERAGTGQHADQWTPAQGRGDGSMFDELSTRHAGPVPASTAPLDQRDEERAGTGQHADHWTPAQACPEPGRRGRGDASMFDELSIRHAGLVPASTGPLDESYAAGAETEQHADEWAPAQACPEPGRRGGGDDEAATAQPPTRDWPSFAEMLAGDPAALARYGVRVV
jgi:hypothetical protein